MKYVGQSVRSLDADEKVTGTAVYTADLTIPGMKFARLICSPYAHARIDGFELEAAREVEGVRAIVTHDTLDLQRLGCIRAIRPYGQAVKDRPVLAHEKVRFQGEPVAIVVADSETAATEAVARIQVHYTPLPQVAEMKSALEGGTLVHDRDAGYDRVGADDFEYDYAHNSCGGTHFVQGNPEQAFPGGRPRHRGPLHLSVAVPLSHGAPLRRRHGRRQVRHRAHLLAGALSRAGRAGPHVRPGEGAGDGEGPLRRRGFGSKGHISVEHLAVLAAAASGVPVQLRLTMEETAFTARRHPAEIEMRTGLREDGTVLCRETKIYLDTGAYADFGIQVTRKAASAP